MASETVSAPLAIPVEETTPIKPSEALRLGRLTRPRPTPGSFLQDEDGACALGAIIEGYGWRMDRATIKRLDSLIPFWPELAIAFDNGDATDSQIVAQLQRAGL